MRRAHRVMMGAAVLFFIFWAPALNAQQTTLTWHGHAAFTLVTPQGAVLMIDPWLKNPVNPAAKDGQDPVAAVKKLDYILITHGHSDHVGEAVALARKTGARLVTNFELGFNLAKLQDFPKDQMGLDTLFNIGGEISIAQGEVQVHMTPAVHSSGMKNPKAGASDPDLVYGGNPGGFVLTIHAGPTVYHTGDTYFFKDMDLIGKQYHPDLALINIGGHFGMEPDMAAWAAKTIRPRWVVPHHFGTFPVLTQSAAAFGRSLAAAGIVMKELKPGQSLRFKGKELVE